MHLEELNPRLRQLVGQELDSEEQIRWVGQPNPKRLMLFSLIPAVMGVFVTGFAIFWISMATWITGQGRSMGGPGDGFGFIFNCFPLFGLIFVVVGIGMMLSPLWARNRAAKTVYALTNKRAILFTQGWGMTVRSFRKDAMEDIIRREYSDGTGDLIFKRESYYRSGHWSGTGSHRHYHGGGWRTREIGFFGIPNVRDVEKMLNELE